jgi:hypothetical protein
MRPTRFNLPDQFRITSAGAVTARQAYIASGMKAFDVPGLAIGIVTGDKHTPRASACAVRRVACRSIRARSSRSGQLPRRANEINLRTRDALYRNPPIGLLRQTRGEPI